MQLIHKVYNIQVRLSKQVEEQVARLAIKLVHLIYFK